MPDTKSTGNSIVFKVGGVAVAGETGCSFSISGSEIEMSNKSTLYWKEFLPGRSDWTMSGGSMLFADFGAGTLSASQKAIFTAITTNAIVAVEIILSAAGGLKFSGNAFFTTMDADFQDENPASFSWAVRGIDALTLIEGEV